MIQQQTEDRGQQTMEDFGTLFVQGAKRLLEIQTAVAENLIRAQGRGATMFGFPDWSASLGNGNGRQFSELFATSADQALNLLRQTNETICSLQQAAVQMLAQQTSQLTAQMRSSMEEIGRQTGEGMRDASQTAQQAVEAAQQQTQLQGTEQSKKAVASGGS
jgi:hypothetical protein